MNYLRLVDAQSFSQTKLSRYMEELCDYGALIMSWQHSARRMPICFHFPRNMGSTGRTCGKTIAIEGLATMAAEDSFFVEPKML